MPEGVPGAPGMPGPRGQVPAPAPTDEDQSKDLELETSTNVRSNFPETWIWTEAMTGYVVVCCSDDSSKTVCTNPFT